jgi:2-dehydropantoate 2-reductase
MADCNVIKRIGIIGRGAIGVNLAYHLQNMQSTQNVQGMQNVQSIQNAENIETELLIRDHYDPSQPLTIHTENGETQTLKCKQCFINENTLSKLDLIVIPVKHYQLESVMKTIAPILPNHTSVMLLHNGMGGIELAEKYLPNNLLLAATTTDGVYKTSANSFVQTAIGQLEMGFANTDEAHLIAPDLNIDYVKKLHPNFHWREDIVFALYQKLAVNAVINPLTALKNCKNGELENYPEEVKKVKDEVFDLYEFMNLPIDNHALSAHIDNVIQLTKLNYSSMHQDFHHGRETEVEGILGFLLQKGEETGMKMDFIRQLYTQISTAK